MKNKSSARRLSYLFTQRIHSKNANNMPKLIKPQLKKTKIELENILRWEDDGGQIIEFNYSTLDRHFVQAHANKRIARECDQTQVPRLSSFFFGNMLGKGETQ